jgi:hypothetical protein
MTFFRNLFKSTHPLPAGVYHYQSPPDDPRDYRLHLRLESDGSGILIVNASTVLHLNPTAAEYAYYLVQNLDEKTAAHQMVSRYSVDRETARRDYRELVANVRTLIETPDLDPVTFLNFERREPFSGAISAPYRLDCALTYNLPEGVSPEFAPTKQVERELTTAEWKNLFDRAYQVGIPHLIFTGGEPTLREDLPELLTHAEKNGQVTGLLTDGLRLAERAYLDTLLQTGLDHLTFVLQPDADSGWNGVEAPAPLSSALEGALAADIFTAVHLTLTSRNIDSAEALLGRLASAGVRAVSLSASDPSLRPALASLRDWTAARQLELIWNLPVPYSAQNPVALETGQEIPEGAGRAWLYIEPDGDVLPSQGMNRVLGNLLRDPWEKIWKSQA